MESKMNFKKITGVGMILDTMLFKMSRFLAPTVQVKVIRKYLLSG